MTDVTMAITSEANISEVFAASAKAGRAADALGSAMGLLNHFRDWEHLDPAVSDAIHKTSIALAAARDANDALYEVADEADRRLEAIKRRPRACLLYTSPSPRD